MKTIKLTFLVVLTFFSLVSFASSSFNSFAFEFSNHTNKSVILQSYEVIQGNWIRSRTPRAQTQYSLYSAIGPLGTESLTVNQGNGGAILLTAGNEVMNFRWNMHWGGVVSYQFKSATHRLMDPRIQYLPDRNHVLLTGILVRKSSQTGPK